MKYKTANESPISIGLNLESKLNAKPECESITEIIEKRYNRKRSSEKFKQDLPLMQPLYEIKESPIVTVRRVQDSNDTGMLFCSPENGCTRNNTDKHCTWDNQLTSTLNEVSKDSQASFSPIKGVEEMSEDKRKRTANMKGFYKENGPEFASELTGISQVV
eukprot:TRINITY_DN968_c0_g2_i5.p3 TRINITY_DN968_c0_g2~~TRINITY_DN968_c0_g2_i5.p3  ORF type:complete len:161 (+),score=12.94 TRINITY_DN968_c0_g2_i5:32-514(+)